MNYTRIYLFGKRQSRGSFDDLYSVEKYNSLQEAYDANDYVECDFVKDENGTLYIEAKNVKNTDIKKYHKLIYQNCPAGVDALDDQLACELAVTLF